MTAKKEEQRRLPRYARQLSVRFGTEARMHSGTAMNISAGGLQIQSAESFPVNSLVTVFVQFTRQTFRLKARVAWSGGASHITGLAFTEPSPALADAYRAWQFEVRDAARDLNQTVPILGPADCPPSPASAPDPEAPAPGAAAAGPASPPVATAAAPAPSSSEPKSPVLRRFETLQGEVFDVRIERQARSWRLTIFQLPRPLGVRDPDLQGTFPDYAAAERAVREFMRSHSQ